MRPLLTLPTSGALVALWLLSCTSPPVAVPAPRATVTAVAGLRAKVLGVDDGGADIQLVLDPHAEIVQTLQEFVNKNAWKSIHFVGLGACTDAVVAYYDPVAKEYKKTALAQQMEIVSLIGDAAQDNKNAGFHAHVALGFPDGTLHGGHLFEAHVAPTLELFVRASNVPMTRRHDEAFGAELLVP